MNLKQSRKELLLKAAVAETSSEARCARAFNAWIAEWEIRPLHRMLLWNGWQAAWKYLHELAVE